MYFILKAVFNFKKGVKNNIKNNRKKIKAFNKIAYNMLLKNKKEYKELILICK